MSDLLDFAEQYMQLKLNTDNWDEMQSATREKWLAEALRQIKSIDGITIPDELTQELKTAICEVCLELMSFTDNEQFKKLQDAGVTSISYGNDSVSFSQSASTSRTGNAYVNDYAYSLLRPYIQRSFKIV